MNKKTICFILTCIVALAAFTVSLAEETKNEGQEGTKSINQILEEMNRISDQDLSSTSLITLACLLQDRASELKPDEIIAMIQNPSNTEVVKVTLIQITRDDAVHDVADYEALYRNLITDISVSDDIKGTAIWSLPRSYDTAMFLSDLLDAEDGPIAFQALKCIESINPELAKEIADNIILNYETESPDRLRGAVKIKQHSIEEAATMNRAIEDQKQLFIEQCQDILNISEDEKLNDTIVIALARMESVEAVETIMFSDKIGSLMKRYTADKNQEILQSIEITDELSYYLKNDASRAATGYEGYAVYRDGVPFSTIELDCMVV